MKSPLFEVQVPGGRIETFVNESAARAYCTKWNGRLIGNAANAAIDGIAAQSAMPGRSPGLCSLLGLSTVALNTKGELEAAWEGNGKKSSPRDTDKIVNALVSFWRARRGGADTDSTLQFLRERHPLLFSSSLAKTAGTANEYRLGANEAEPGIVLGVGPVLKFAL